MPTFPFDFVFGVATSAFQIEGAWDADGKGASIWDTFGHMPGNVDGDVPGDVACDHYHRYPEDIALMRGMGCDSYRFSFSWPRILPEGVGQANPLGLDFYDRLVDAMLEAGIVPNATLYHWDLPQALQDRGGWPHPDSPQWFAEYAGLVASRFGDRIPLWSTLNEPISLWVGYGMGVFAPGIADPVLGRQAMHNGLVAHGLGVMQLREAAPEADIGLVLDIWKRHPSSDSDADQAIADRDEDTSFRFFLDGALRGGYGARVVDTLEREGTMPVVRDGDFATMSQGLDYLGLNVYGRVVVDAQHYNPEWWVTAGQHPSGNYLQNGMEFYPKSVYDAIMLVRDEYADDLPLFITENGVADGDGLSADECLNDAERIDYIRGFLTWIARAMDHGADVRGYYAWSLIDNYEWAAAFTKKFGLVHVDPDTLERTPKASARWYAKVIEARGF
ncbi:GH1 family beta-glucosidase [uncultured Demequina sp.]|uniref:GH1 family beta-glucosidase n=1 Tax=uncultured Demequina sp. TaxID=693499 RepID=UPI0025DFA5CD|nr:GH1 family beta-glucosidase [uncultured Demequina sp.]